MARNYAAVMALLAMLVVLLRAMKNHSGFDGTIANALGWMAIFGLVGFVVGAIAQATVDESVLQNMLSKAPAPAPKLKPELPTAAT